MSTSPKKRSAISGVSRTGRTRSKPDQKKPTESTAVSLDRIRTSDDIAKLAYAIWEARGCTGGSAEEDWLRAEQQILARS